MNTDNHTATDLIARSISHTEIVSADCSADLEAELNALCDDSVHTGSIIEYWGTDDDGNQWRVHLRGACRESK